MRDLTFRAYAEWGHPTDPRNPEAIYRATSALLNRALTMRPNDPLGLYIKATINLCDCVDGWSTNPAEQEAIGTAAMESYLRTGPFSSTMLLRKAQLYRLHLRFEDSLALTESILQREPDNVPALSLKTSDLLKLDRLVEAAATMRRLSELTDEDDQSLLAAVLNYRTGNYSEAARFARMATTTMSREQFSDPSVGWVTLALAAAEARLGHAKQARAALAEFTSAVPNAATIRGVRAWMPAQYELAGYEPFYDGLRLAGAPD